MKKFLVMVMGMILTANFLYAENTITDEYGLTWYTNLQVAKEIAAEENKPILLFAGRDTCGNCNYTKRTSLSATSPNNLELLEENYVMMYCDVDYNYSYYGYFDELTSYTLPFIAILPVNAYDKTYHQSSGIIKKEEMYDLLEEHKDAEADLTSLEYMPYNWYTDYDEGIQAAIEEDKPVFLFAGRETCMVCNSVQKKAMQSIDEYPVKGTLVSNYIMIYQDVDFQYEFWKFNTNTGSISLPFIAVIEEASTYGSQADFLHTGNITAEELYEAIK